MPFKNWKRIVKQCSYGVALVATAEAPLIPAALHAGPPVTLEVIVKKEEVNARLAGEQKIINRWIGLEHVVTAPFDAAFVREMHGRMTRFWQARNELTIDGGFVEIGTVEIKTPKMLTAQLGTDGIEISCKFPVEEWPQRIRLFFTHFESLQETEGVLPGQFVQYGDRRWFELSENEPEFIWHAPVIKARPTLKPEQSPAAEGWPVSYWSLMAGVLAAALAATRIQSRFKMPWALPIALLLVAGLLRDARPALLVPLPFDPTPSVPNERTAVELFQKLHTNIYLAFDANTEEGIYQTLAQSVGPELLDRLFVEIYESLILRSEGGAVCQVDHIEVLEHEYLGAIETEQTPTFALDWRWRVHGAVSHWGHTHSRVNQYRARYHVSHLDQGWRITGVEVTERERLHGEAPTDESSDD